MSRVRQARIPHVHGHLISKGRDLLRKLVIRFVDQRVDFERELVAVAKTAAACAAGAILYYVRSTQRGSLDHVDRIGWYERQNCLVLDAVTVRNLELIEPLFAGTDPGVTLFRSIDCAVTPMGKRLLRAWLLRPSLDVAEIDGRLDAVEASCTTAKRHCSLMKKCSAPLPRHSSRHFFNT